MVNRVILGNLGSSYGLKISKPAVEVTTAVSKDLLFDSSRNYLRSLITGTLTLAAGATASTSINLGSTYASNMFYAYLDTTSYELVNLLTDQVVTAVVYYYASLSNTGLLTFGRICTSGYTSSTSGTITYTVFGT